MSLRDFRSYASADLALGTGLTVVVGRNGAGKTNLLEGLFVGCTSRSFRTTIDREAIRFGQPVARIELSAEGEDGPHEIGVGLARGAPKRVRVDGIAVEHLADVQARPLASVFAPDRLELVKGGPALRRSHLDQVVAALWPARVETRRAYARALAQRNALISRIRAGAAAHDALGAWDLQLARHGVALMDQRRQAVGELAPGFASIAGSLGLDGDPRLAYRPRSRSETEDALAAELRQRLDSDLERGFTGHGPHRDELLLSREGRELRAYGSQGQQRLGLLALLLAERGAIARVRSAPPLMLLDDVLSELDAERRRRLVELLAADEGQCVITTTDLDHVPGAREPGVCRVAVADGSLIEVAADRDAA